MDNYKIKVIDEAESKEAQELFFEIGFHWKWSNKREILRESIPYLFTNGKDIYYGVSLTEFDKCEGEELTLPQLRDLVDQRKSKERVLMGGANDAELVEQSKKFIKPDHLNRFEAAQAHLEGKQVQFLLSNGAFFDITDDSTVGIFSTDGGYSFRLKPTTLTVNAELPKPSNTTLHNQNYSVTYELKTREDRNAFVEGLGGNNS